MLYSRKKQANNAGRPPLSEGDRTVRKGFTATESFMVELEALAVKEGLTLSKLIRKMARQYMGKDVIQEEE